MATIKLAILQSATVLFDVNGNKQYFPTEDEAIVFYREKEQELKEGGKSYE